MLYYDTSKKERKKERTKNKEKEFGNKQKRKCLGLGTKI
jgi:hypothetical protein